MVEGASFLVAQEHFSGTLGELAHALRSRQLAPEEIDLYALVRSYLNYFEEHAPADMEGATEALPRLAQVIELKVRLLLPGPPEGEGVTEEHLTEEALAAVTLLEELEEAIGFLKRRREERRLLLPARARRPEFPRPRRPERATPSELARIATLFPITGYFELHTEQLTMASMTRSFMNALKRLGRATLALLTSSREWPVRTVGLAALLELIREGHVDATQDEPFGEIVVTLKGRLGATPEAAADEQEEPYGEAPAA